MRFDPLTPSVVLIMAVPMALLVTVFHISRRIRRARGKRNPLVRSLLRPPGAGLREQLETSKDQLLEVAILVAVVSGFMAGLFIAQQYADLRFGVTFWSLSGTSVALVLMFAVRRIIRLQNSEYKQWLGLDDKQITF